MKMMLFKIFPKKSRIFGVGCGFILAIGGVIGWIVMPYLVVKLIDLVVFCTFTNFSLTINDDSLNLL